MFALSRTTAKFYQKSPLKKLRKELRKRPKAVDNFFAKGSIRYQHSSRKLTLGVAIAFKKDKFIGMSFSFFGITMAKIKVTPDKVSCYEKRGGTYFEGGYDKIRRLLKIPVNFDMLQNIFLARKILPAFTPTSLEKRR